MCRRAAAEPQQHEGMMDEGDISPEEEEAIGILRTMSQTSSGFRGSKGKGKKRTPLGASLTKACV